jgi:hypothetical protein
MITPPSFNVSMICAIRLSEGVSGWILISMMMKDIIYQAK